MSHDAQHASTAPRTIEATLIPGRASVLKSPLCRRLLGGGVVAALLPLAVVSALEWLEVQDRLHLKAAVIAVAVVLGLSWRHVLRIAAALVRLEAGTRRIVEHDYSLRMPARGRDEVAQLSRSFNDMARNLGMNFMTLNVLAEIDQTILTKPQISDVAKSTLRCMRSITSAQVVMLGLFEDEATESMRVYALRREGQPKIRFDFALTDELKERIARASTPGWQPHAPLPDAMLTRLHQEDGVTQYWTQPIARGDRAWGVLMFGHGETIGLTKNQRSLLARVEERLEVAFATLERDRKLRTMAHVDPLTGLPNRASMLSLLAQELAEAHRQQRGMAVLFLDLDRFKRANDTLGHAAGDILLRLAAQRIRDNLHAADTVARSGGDEFTILLGNLSSGRDAGHVARRLIKALSRPFEVEGHTVYVGASVGIAVYPQDGEQGSDLLKKADNAMYRAKEMGRNRFAYYEEGMNIEAQRRAALDRELRQAFERNELVLHYQPQIDLRTGRVCAAEALVRWQHPEQGLLYPAAFIPFAEENGLIDAVGSWVLREACQQFQRWQRDGVPIQRIAVNVSNRQLLRSNFMRTIHYLLHSNGMQPGSLEIEVTESMFVDSGQAGIEALKLLAAAGVRIAIDDFGTGYSSFGYLKTLPFSILKLDKTFLDDAPGNSDAATIVTAIVDMARTLRKEVVAEGVEREDQYRFLQQLGCEKIQGFLFSRPLTAAAISEYAWRRAHEPDESPLAEPALG